MQVLVGQHKYLLIMKNYYANKLFYKPIGAVLYYSCLGSNYGNIH